MLIFQALTDFTPKSIYPYRNLFCILQALSSYNPTVVFQPTEKGTYRMKKTDNTERRTKGTGRVWFDERQGVYKGRIRIAGKDKYLTLTANERESLALWKKFVEDEKPRARAEFAKLPLEEVWPRIREEIAASHGGINPRRYTDAWRWCKEFLEGRGVKYMEDATAADISAFVSSKFAPLASATRNGYVCALKRIWAVALPDIKAADNPTRGLGMVAQVSESREAFSDEELAALLNAAKAKGDDWHRLITVGLNTGLRLKDCVYLSSDKIKNGVISLVPYKTAKKAGTRVNIPLNAALHSVLDGIEGPYFPKFIEKYEKCEQHFSRALRRVFTAAGIDTAKEVQGRCRKASTKGFHALRATFITRLSEAGCSMGLIQSMAGHTADAMTLAYTHPNQTALQAAVDSLPQFDGAKVESAKYVSAEASTIADTTADKVLDALRRMGLAEVDDTDYKARLAPIEAKLEKLEGMTEVERNAACIGAAFAIAEMMGIPSTLSA
jgi:integrase